MLSAQVPTLRKIIEVGSRNEASFQRLHSCTG
jgi:hypothetical protein